VGAERDSKHEGEGLMGEGRGVMSINAGWNELVGWVGWGGGEFSSLELRSQPTRLTPDNRHPKLTTRQMTKLTNTYEQISLTNQPKFM